MLCKNKRWLFSEVIVNNMSVFFLIFVSFSFSLKATELPRLSINVYGQKNGKGLQTDLQIMGEALEKLGQSVRCLDYMSPSAVKADINIFFQEIPQEKLKNATLNWFVPNPEWCSVKPEVLEKIDLILCRTKFVEEIFHKLARTYFLGFTSPDTYVNKEKKNYDLFLHLAGGSLMKGTRAVLKAWKKNINLPSLFLITHYDGPKLSVPKNVRLIHRHLRLNDLRHYQNRCGIHVCPSEAEGFGHTLMESMAAGAVLVTTDAPPMNEFITDPRCLVPYNRTKSQFMGMSYYVDDRLLGQKIEALRALSEIEKEEIGLKNRQRYEEMTVEFHQNLKKLLQETCSIED